MDFTTLGMFIIDEIDHPPPTPPSSDIVGGAGTYAALGARLFRPPPSSAKVGWVVHKGCDFPAKVGEEVQGWQTGVKWVDTPERNTTRGWNGYVGEERAFKFTTEKIRVDEKQLTDAMILSASFHMVCTPARCMNLVKGIIAQRECLGEAKNLRVKKPLFVWEPSPDSCSIDSLNSVLEATQYVDVVSPNHTELASLFVADGVEKNEDENWYPASVEERCEALLRRGFKTKDGAVVVRCGSKGCFIKSRTEQRMFPAFYASQEGGRRRHSKVVDPTGAGNAFLGAFSIGLVEDRLDGLTRLESAAVYGTIAASFAVEQIGLPKLTVKEDQELWNGEQVQERFNNFIDRTAQGTV